MTVPCDAVSTARVLLNLFLSLGIVPSEIQTDNGGQFTSEIVKFVLISAIFTVSGGLNFVSLLH